MNPPRDARRPRPRSRALALVLAHAMTTCWLAGLAEAQEPPAASPSVASIQAQHDRALIKDLAGYIAKNPKADDIDQAYMSLFDKVIEHDWFTEFEGIGRSYLTARPDGPVASLARIVGTMARAQAHDYPEALKRFKDLMTGLGQPEQEEFASNFADNLAAAATGAGEYAVARQVYSALLDRYGDSTTLRQKVKDDLARLDRVGQPAPEIVAKDIKGDPFRLDGLKGKYVLVDFWATWCAPCIAELPRLQAAHARYREQGFEIVGVSLDETKADVVDFLKARGIPWRQIHNASAEGDLVAAFGVNSIPATFLVDPKGVITRLELRGAALDEALARIWPNAPKTTPPTP